MLTVTSVQGMDQEKLQGKRQRIRTNSSDREGSFWGTFLFLLGVSGHTWGDAQGSPLALGSGFILGSIWKDLFTEPPSADQDRCINPCTISPVPQLVGTVLSALFKSLGVSFPPTFQQCYVTSYLPACSLVMNQQNLLCTLLA